MPGILNVSEATALALHAMIYMEVNNDRKVSTREIAEVFDASEAHLSKVLQRLVKAGLLESIRGPKGGFSQGKPSDEVSLLHLYEIFEGPISENICLFHKPVCKLKRCVMDDFFSNVYRQFVDFMTETTICDAAKLYKEGM